MVVTDVVGIRTDVVAGGRNPKGSQCSMLEELATFTAWVEKKLHKMSKQKRWALVLLSPLMLCHQRG